MAIEMRSIRCHHFRVSREPCENPAVVEILGPQPHLLCAEHAAMELNADPGWAHQEGWETHGAEEYARYCEEAVNALEGWMRTNGGDEPFADNPVLEMILEEALTYLEEYELERARRVLERQGGRREETVREKSMREGLEKLSSEAVSVGDAALTDAAGDLPHGAEGPRCHVGSATDKPCMNPAAARVNSTDVPDMCAVHALQVALRNTEIEITAALKDLEGQIETLLTGSA
jgi:hypothetical protein